MTHIEQMIQDMCPNGVEWKTFDELGAFYGGLSGKTKDDFKEGNEKFITYLNIANNPALRLDIDETVKIGPNEKQNIVQYGDALFTGSSETPDECAMSSVVTDYPQEKLYLNSFCFGFRFNSLEGICPAFYKHYFRSDHFRKAVRRTANGTTRFNVSKKEFGKLSIPLPPIEIQKKIVECLDKFSALAAELQAELQLRRKQYEYYRTQLLTPHSDCNSADNTDDCNWEWKTLGDIAELVTKQTGFDYSNSIKPALLDKPVEGSIPFLQTRNFSGRDFDYNTEYYVPANIVDQFPKIVLDKECLLLSIVGASIGNVGLFPGKTKCFLGGAICVLKFKEGVNIPYIYEYLSSCYGQRLIRSKIKGAGQATITIEDIRNFSIPFPSVEKQERIATLLGRFGSLTSDLSDGIPAEQAAQQKRYEYYRDLLLTFDRKAV